MMKRIIYIPLLLLLLLVSCEKREIIEPPTPPSDGVLINILLPKVTDRESITRTWPDNGMSKKNMPANSTIRLFVYEVKLDESGMNNNPVTNNLVREVTYRVRSQDEITPADQRALILCDVNPVTGAPTDDITDTDLHLPPGEYDFFAVSPAIEIPRFTISGLPVPAYEFRHGGIRRNTGTITPTLYTSEPVQNVQVQSNSSSVGGEAGFYNLELKTFTLLASRIRFIIMPGEEITSLEIENRGIVMNNLTYNTIGNYNFRLGDPELRPVRFPRPGDPDYQVGQPDPTPGVVSITSARNISGEPKGYEPGTYGPDTWELITEVIPNPSPEEDYETGRTDVGLTYNLLVNGGNYKSYQSQLIGQRFERGSEYTYEVSVNAGGIFVRGWRNIGWEVTIPK